MDKFHNQICLLNVIFEFQANHRRRWYYLHIVKQLQVYSLDERGIFFKTMILNRYPDCEYISFYTLSGLGLNASTTAANLSKEKDEMFASCRFSEDSACNEALCIAANIERD
ncbi:PREDICTED: uncharacterized protein LOC104751487 [Camelina sativa]|uniref:Uncharacterized protein LOC104751487 n=1 Tax=Camelina sativa TaxID=90675 RepID=A0ABM0WIZ2_CAMSA|nr:PREDICTED: uncharacterized protein LOC104751487 [Camelina sativa]